MATPKSNNRVKFFGDQLVVGSQKEINIDKISIIAA